MSKPTYNDAQWMWMYERTLEGYYLEELSDFCGLSSNSVRANLYHRTPYLRALKNRDKCRDYTRLSDRTDEFNRLGGFYDHK